MTKKIIIIGGGPGGYVAAIRGAQLGARVTVVEKEALGGTCLNWGCVPTKTLLHASRLYKMAQNVRPYGIYATVDSFRFDRMVAKKNEVVRNNVRGIEAIFRRRNIELIKGTARLSSLNTVEIEQKQGATLNSSADAVIIATGSEPLVPGDFQTDADRIITTTEALDLDTLPRSIAIVGGSVSGCEFACLFSHLGSRVCLIEMQDRLIPAEDPEVSRRLGGALKRMGVRIMTGTYLKKLDRQYPEGSVNLVTDAGEVIADYCLLALGRKLNTAGIGLDELDISYTSQGIQVDQQMQTSAPGIYAAGDVTGKHLMAHVASEQGIVAAEQIMGLDTTMDYAAVPNFIYTDPEVASVGLKAVDGVEMGFDVIQGKATYKTNAMAQAMDQTTGFVKAVVDQATRRILGVHMIGPHATDLISEAVTMVKAKMTVDEVKQTIHPHPTLSETLKEAVLASIDQAVHV